MFQLKFAVITPALITGSFAERVRFSAYLVFICSFQHRSSTARSRTGRGIRRASCGSGACSISPAARSSTCQRDSPRSPARSCWGGARATKTAAFRRRPTSLTCCSAPACCGSDGSASTPDRRSRRMRRRRWRSRRRTSRRRRRCWRGSCSTSRAAAAPRRWARASARSSASSRSPRRPATSASRTASSSASWRAWSATWRCTGSRKSNLDDTLDVFPCHGVGGIVGMLLTGVLARDVGLFAGKRDVPLSPAGAGDRERLQLLRIAGAVPLTDWILPIRVTPGAGSGRPRSEPARRVHGARADAAIPLFGVSADDRGTDASRQRLARPAGRFGMSPPAGGPFRDPGHPSSEPDTKGVTRDSPRCRLLSL